VTAVTMTKLDMYWMIVMATRNEKTEENEKHETLKKEKNV
jgi:hypothetical protein